MASQRGIQESDNSRTHPTNPIGEVNNVGGCLDLMKMKASPLPPRQHKWNPSDPSRVSLTLDLAIEYELQHGRQLDPNMDTKTLRRTISNRLSAQRSRMKRNQYMIDMEKMARDLEVKVASLKPKLEILKEKRRLLQEENDSLRGKIKIREAEAIEGEQKLEEMQNEIRSLNEGLINIRNESNPKPYSLEFYQQRLMELEMNQLISQVLNTSSSPAAPAVEPCFDEDEEEEVDQYLNLDDATFYP